jgi:gamma-glutamyltranspeptidase/glutathione hydrolase
MHATGRSVMMTTSHPLATEAGVAALRKGGTAVDAYLTAALLQTVLEPTMTTLAGSLGITCWDEPKGRLLSLGAGFSSPKGEAGEFAPGDYVTARTAMVPGFVAGIHHASRLKGKLPWRDLFEPAIHYAEEGFVIDHLLWGWAYEYSKWLGRYPEGRAIWYRDGYLLSVGDRLRQPQLAATLRRLAADGPEYFYRGPFARKFVEAVRSRGSRMTEADLASAWAGVERQATEGASRSAEAAPRGRFREYEVLAPSNAMMILALNVVEAGDLRSRGRPTRNADVLYYLLRIIQEIWHAGFEYRAETREQMLSKEYATTVWGLVESGPPRPYRGIDAGTCGVAVVDSEGSVAVGTHTSSSSPFGTGIFVDGIVVNRVIYSRTVRFPSGLSTSHLVLRDGKPYFAIASPSRSFLTNIFQNTVNVLEFGMGLDESVSQPLFGAPGPLYPGEEIENRFPDEVLSAVERRGVPLVRIAPGYIHLGSGQAVLIDRKAGRLYGVADPRRLGLAAGY